MNILEISMQENDAGASTIGEYLRKLLATLWEEGESFSGKRPFGNSGWEYDIYTAMVVAGVVNGTIDSEGYLEVFDEIVLADKIILRAIKSLK